MARVALFPLKRSLMAGGKLSSDAFGFAGLASGATRALQKAACARRPPAALPPRQSRLLDWPVYTSTLHATAMTMTNFFH
jgi:hypothetical protein